MTGGPINPDREQQRADNRASWRQSHFGPLPEEPENDRAEQGPDSSDGATSGDSSDTKEDGEPQAAERASSP